MNTIKIYLSSSGSLAELEKSFPIYQGAFNATLLNVYVPTSLLLGTGDIQYVDGTGFVHTTPGVFTALKIGMVSLGRDGRIDKTKAYYMRYLEKVEYQGIEYALYERALPQAFTLFEGQGLQAPKLIINVVNMENNNEYNGEEIIVREPKIIRVITSQQCSLDVLPSANFDIDEFIEPSEWDIVNGYIDDLYEKYDYIVNNIDETIADYTYSKDVIDQKDADTLQLAKDYADENFYNETESDARFVHLTGRETIGGTKTFTDSPAIPNASADMHATNREDLQNYTYSRAEIGSLTQPISFETEQNFLDWLAGSFLRPDGLLPSELLLGKKVIIKETSKNNYQVATVPALTLADYKILVEDTKALEEIIARPYKDIEATDGQEFVEDLKDQIDLKSQVVNLGATTILSSDWVLENDLYVFEYTNENYTDKTKQALKFINNSVEQSEQIIAESITFLGFEDTADGVKIVLSAQPTFDMVLEVQMITYTDILLTPEELAASMVSFDNTGTGLSAINVQQAIVQVNSNLESFEIDTEEALDLKFNKSDVVHSTGEAYDKVISQMETTRLLDLKPNKTAVDGKFDEVWGYIESIMETELPSKLDKADIEGKFVLDSVSRMSSINEVTEETIHSASKGYADGYRKGWHIFSNSLNLNRGLYKIIFRNINVNSGLLNREFVVELVDNVGTNFGFKGLDADYFRTSYAYSAKWVLFIESTQAINLYTNLDVDILSYLEEPDVRIEIVGYDIKEIE